jgi:hypothetical protein
VACFTAVKKKLFLPKLLLQAVLLGCAYAELVENAVIGAAEINRED